MERASLGLGEPSLSEMACRFLSASDMDGDGDLDPIGVLSKFPYWIVWYENDGSGLFGDRHNVGPREDSFEVVDLDGDGDSDVVAASATVPDVIGWYVNDGNGVFGEELLVASGTSVHTVGLSDMDGDGGI